MSAIVIILISIAVLCLIVALVSFPAFFDSLERDIEIEKEERRNKRK